jgi:thioredoxin 1
MSDKHIIVLDEENFDREVIESKIPVMIDFWAEWCGPCQAVMPIINELALEFEGVVKIAKLNVDENRSIAMRYRVMSIPTVLFFKDGEEAKREVGAKSKDDYIQLLDSMI